MTTTIAKFSLGRTLITPGAQRELNADDVFESMARHARGDWGECSKEDSDENELSLKKGFRLLSVYRDRRNVKFWIITEADRSATTVLLPDEY